MASIVEASAGSASGSGVSGIGSMGDSVGFTPSGSSVGTNSLMSGGASASSNNLWDELMTEALDGGNDDVVDAEQAAARMHQQRDSILFLIDCSAAMFERPSSAAAEGEASSAATAEKLEDAEVPFDCAIRCVIATLTDKIVSNESDLVGVMLYGTKKSREEGSFHHVYQFLPLEPPDAQAILNVERLLNPAHRDHTFGGSAQTEYEFAEVLWAVSTAFASPAAAKVGHKRVFLFTNEDNPNGSSQALQARARTRAQDLSDVGVEIELFSMQRAGAPRFDPTKFYTGIISCDTDELGASAPLAFDAAAKFEELRARVRRKEHRKRALGRIPLRIGKDLEIATQLYNLQQVAKPPAHQWMDGRTYEPVKSTTRWLCSGTGAILNPRQIAKVYPLGGQDLEFTEEEIAAVKQIDRPGLQLMGFKPRSALKSHHNLRNNSFLYPDDTTISGSAQAFGALLEKMLELNRIGIARLTARQSSAPRMVALLPQRETVDADGTLLYPPGMHVIYLPYADDIRQLDLPEPVALSPEDIRVAKDLVRKIHIRFDSSNFENPALQKHFASVQALALDREQVEETPDHTLPDVEGMLRYKDRMIRFNQQFFGTDVGQPAAASIGSKRRAPTGSGASKRSRGASAEVDFSSLTAADIPSQTVANLKSYLQSVGIRIPPRARKADLVALALEKFNS